MKNLKLSIGLLLLMSTTFISAKVVNPKKSAVSINKELTALLKPKADTGLLEQEETVKVKIVITPNNEILVVQVNSDNSELSSYIKNSLNYKKLQSADLEGKTAYNFDVKFKL